MINIVKKDKYKILIAFIITTIIFSAFLGQEVFSDVITFAKLGDQDKQCFAGFLKIREILLNKESFVGIDSGSFNGATEFYLRSNMSVAYLPYYIFAYLSLFIPARGAYILFYALHMFLALYIYQKLCEEIFNLNRISCFVLICLYAYLLASQAWYLGHYLNTVLTCVLFHSGLRYVNYKNPANLAFFILSVILAVTTGYITVAAFVIIIDYILLLSYTLFYKENRTFSNFLRVTIPFVVGGLISLGYLLSIFIYARNVVQADTNLYSTIYYKFNLSDILSIISSYSFSYTSNTENVSALSFGLITCLVIVYSIIDKAIDRVDKRKKTFIIINVLLTIIIIIWSGENTALTGILYALLPVLGGMHIPNRYLMVIYPFLYISIGILAQEIRWNKYNKSLRNVFVSGIVVLVIYVVLNKCGLRIEFIRDNNFILEMLCTLAFIYFIYRSNNIKISYIIWGSFMILIGTTIFYESNNLYAYSGTINNQSIVYNTSAQQAIDAFIDKTGDSDKEMYRILAYDSIDSVPVYLLSNYEWYNQSKYDLCNYTGYELQLATPYEYRLRHSWFNVYDYEYVVNTRADYFLTDYATIENNELLNGLIDWDKGTADIGNGRIMVKFKYFIPSTICGTEYVYEDKDSLDNGYFYSHDLTNDNIVSFDTNQSSYYKMTINSDESSVLAFLPYPNRYYHYYIDGTEQNSEIVNMQAIIRLDKGEHTIEIKYENKLGTVGFYSIMGGASALLIIGCVCRIIEDIKKNKSNNNQESFN